MLDSGSNKFFTLWNNFFSWMEKIQDKEKLKNFKKRVWTECATSWRMYKVNHVMQPHGFEGSFRSRSIKIGYNTAHEVCKWFKMMFYSQIVQSVTTSWRMYKVHLVMQPHGFERSFRSRSIKIGYKTAHEVCKWFKMISYSQTVPSCALILEDVQSASCDAATWLWGFI
jgi:hypothetical protein